MFVKQLTVFLENRVGSLQEITDILKDSEINVFSISLADTSEYGLLRMIVSDPELGKKVLTEAGISARLTDVIAEKTLKIGEKLSFRRFAKVEADVAQTSPEAVYYMQPISAAYYIVSGEKFATWGDKCGQYADPKDGATYVKYTYNKNEIVQDLLETATDAQPAANILVDGKVYTMGSKVLTKLAHDWVAQLNKEGKIATFKCSRCGVVATVVDSSFNAPKDAKLIKVGELLAYYYEDGKSAAGNGTSSPKTFDAGIAMYVGMSLMSVAGSAVVIGKKKEF